MKHITLWLFVLTVIGLLFLIGRYLLKEHKKMYGVCWKNIIEAAIDSAKNTRDQQIYKERINEIVLSTGFVKNFTREYDGAIDLDIAFPMINPEWEYFKLLRIKLRNKTGYSFPVYMDFLERAIFHYNADTEYAITTRQLIEHVNRIFDEYYAKEIKQKFK
jgi:hypothetical protein